MTPAMLVPWKRLIHTTNSIDVVSIRLKIISENTEPYDILGTRRLTGEDIHKAFLEAVESQKSWHESELKVLDELRSLSTGNREVYLG